MEIASTNVTATTLAALNDQANQIFSSFRLLISPYSQRLITISSMSSPSLFSRSKRAVSHGTLQPTPAKKTKPSETLFENEALRQPRSPARNAYSQPEYLRDFDIEEIPDPNPHPMSADAEGASVHVKSARP